MDLERFDGCDVLQEQDLTDARRRGSRLIGIRPQQFPTLTGQIALQVADRFVSVLEADPNSLAFQWREITVMDHRANRSA